MHFSVFSINSAAVVLVEILDKMKILMLIVRILLEMKNTMMIFESFNCFIYLTAART